MLIYMFYDILNIKPVNCTLKMPGIFEKCKLFLHFECTNSVVCTWENFFHSIFTHNFKINTSHRELTPGTTQFYVVTALNFMHMNISLISNFTTFPLQSHIFITVNQSKKVWA